MGFVYAKANKLWENESPMKWYWKASYLWINHLPVRIQELRRISSVEINRNHMAQKLH